MAQAVAAEQAIRSDIDQLRQDFNARLAALESRLATLEGGTAGAASTPSSPGAAPTAQVPSGAVGSGGPSGALPVYGNAVAGAKVFNPDMAVIGNFLGAAGKTSVNPLPALALPESELSLQAIVDPYARADFFFSFGGEEPMADAGISVAWLIPNPWMFLEATGQVFRGDGNHAFHSSRRKDLGYVGHVRGYQDIAESTNLDVGASYAYGHNNSGVVGGADLGRFTTTLFGVDGTLRWRPLRRAIYDSFVGRGEAIWSRRDQPLEGRQQASGFYPSADYQLNRRWFTGVRFDRSDRAAAATLHDNGQSLVVTYWPSEFSQVRGQFRRTKYAEGETANEVLFQILFAIGAHGAHPF